MKEKCLALAMAAVALLSGACARESEDPAPAPPQQTVPTPLGLGQARLTPSDSAVVKGDTVSVTLEVATDTQSLGAFSAKVFFNRGAFELVSVKNLDPILGEPFETSQPVAGILYLAFTNSSPPSGVATGQRRLAEIEFRAVGGPGARLHLNGQVLSLGNTAFYGEPIGSGGFPRAMEVAGDVVIKGK